MSALRKANKTTVGTIDSDVLSYTAGRDIETDLALVEPDCIGSAAHVTMLSRIRSTPKLLTATERDRIVSALVHIIGEARRGRFRITKRDQDAHLAIEHALVGRLGAAGKKVHTARSRNDQVAVALRLYAREEIVDTLDELADLVAALLTFAQKHRMLPMAGRTHMQPAMPSSVGLWSSAYAESLLDDAGLLLGAYDFNDQCPLGAAAGYGVPLPIDRALTSRLLGFGRPCHNVLHAVNSRGKCESVILFAMAQAMITLSRLATDMIIFAMPEFSYFILPAEFCTGSSIMPQKHNPDVLELVRARAATVMAHTCAVTEIMRGLPGGYNRDMQETKAPFMAGIAETRAGLRIMSLLVRNMTVDRKAILKGFSPGVFAADRALRLVAGGMSFRDAYDNVRTNLATLANEDPFRALALKTHLGAPAGLDLDLLTSRTKAVRSFAAAERKHFHRVVSRLLGVPYPGLGS